jgi:hypothetical protein
MFLGTANAPAAQGKAANPALHNSGTAVPPPEPPPPPEPEDIELYIVAGQSNAHGHSPIADLSSSQSSDINIGFHTAWHHNTSNATTTLYYSGYTNKMELGKTRGDSTETSLDSDYFGIEWGFGKILESNYPDRNIGIVKYAVGASTINDSTYADWDLSKTDECWQALKNTIADALTKIGNANLNPVWKGFVWYQGESDSQKDPWVYKEELGLLITALEQELGVTNLPSVFCAPADANGNDLYVNNAHASLAKSQNYYDWVKISDYHDGTYSNVHLNAANMYDAGEAVGNAMASAVLGNSTDTEFAPIVTNTQFWLDADDDSTITKNTSTTDISKIVSKGSTAIDILPYSKDSNFTASIKHSPTSIAGRSSLLLSDDREYLESSGLVTLSTGTQDWFIVAKPDINNGQDALWATEAGNAITFIPLGSTGSHYFKWYWTGNIVSSNQASVDQDGVLGLYCIRWDWANNQTSTWFNGSQIDNNRAAPTNISVQNCRFVFMSQYGNGIVTDGNFCEAIVSTDLNNREKVEGYLAHKWGLGNKLPSSHSYKYYAP